MLVLSRRYLPVPTQTGCLRPIPVEPPVLITVLSVSPFHSAPLTAPGAIETVHEKTGEPLKFLVLRIARQ